MADLKKDIFPQTESLRAIELVFGTKGMLDPDDLRNSSVKNLAKEHGCNCSDAKYIPWEANSMQDKRQISRYNLSFDVSHPKLPGIEIQLCYESSASEWACLLDFRGSRCGDSSKEDSFKYRQHTGNTSLQDAGCILYIPATAKGQSVLNQIPRDVVVIAEYIKHKLGMEQDHGEALDFFTLKNSAWHKVAVSTAGSFLEYDFKGFDANVLQKVFQTLLEAAEFFDVYARDPDSRKSIDSAIAESDKLDARRRELKKQFDSLRQGGASLLDSLKVFREKDQ